MAKSDIAEKFAKLPKIRQGRSVFGELTPQQQKKFLEWVSLYRDTPAQQQPSQDELAKAMTADIGYFFSKYTIARYLRDNEYTNRQKIR
jgi:hypothetical protein